MDIHEWVEKDRPWGRDTLADSEQVRIERVNGSQLTLEDPRIGEDERGSYLAGRTPGTAGEEVRLDLAEIRVLEVREVDTGAVVAGIAAGIVVVGALLLLVFQPFLPSA